VIAVLVDVLDVGLELDQATVDARFAAIVLAEAPWGAPEAAPIRTRRRTTTTTRLASARWRHRTLRDRAAVRPRRHGGAREPRRRPGSVARSPPPSG
jgi:hypothetical protein